jgi:hypothetical protein
MKITADVRLYIGSKTKEIIIEIDQEDIRNLVEQKAERHYDCDSAFCQNIDFSVTLD